MQSFKCGKGIVVVDDADAEFVGELKLRRLLSRQPNGAVYVYAQCLVGKKWLLLHRVLLDVPRNMVVDHIDHDGMNNQRENLRVCTHTENMRNRRKTENTQTGFKGVESRRGKYRFAIRTDAGRLRSPFMYNTPQEAHSAYVEAAKKHHGGFFNAG